MPKFFVKQEQIQDNKIFIEGQDVNHIVKVLRSKVGDEVLIGNSQNGENFLCVINDITDNKIFCNIMKRLDGKVDSIINVTIFQGLPKSDKMEYVIQKSVELGAYDITPVEMIRCVVKLDEKDKNKKNLRWQKISEVAAKQCGRDIIPKINKVVNVKNLCDLIKEYDIVLVAYENEKQNSLKEKLIELKEKIKMNRSSLKIGVVIGPEGGFEVQEIKCLQESGAKIITLGKRILRTETVALNVLSIIMYELDN